MYLIDGNNVMGQQPGWHRDRPGARRKLLLQLSEFARTTGDRLAVVFDGRPEPHFPDGSRFRGVTVFYAFPGSDADHRIVEMVEHESNRRALTVVTSDRALAVRVRACGVETMRSGEFRRMLDQVPAPNVPEQSDPASVIPTEETTAWMRYFGVDRDDPEDEENP
jgi:predicted RNA-binding protein with PIN domain